MTNKEQPRPEPAVGQVWRYNGSEEWKLTGPRLNGSPGFRGEMVRCPGVFGAFGPGDFEPGGACTFVRHAPSPKEDDVEAGSRWRVAAGGVEPFTVTMVDNDGVHLEGRWDDGTPGRFVVNSFGQGKTFTRLPTEERAPRARQASVDGVTWRDCTEGDDLSMYRYIRTSDGNGWAVRELAAPQPAKPQPAQQPKRATYESLMQEARVADGLSVEVPKCRRGVICSGNGAGPLNDDGLCVACYSTDDRVLMATGMWGKRTPAPPAAPPWTPEDPEGDIPWCWE